jgi:hypothetical protein
MRLARFTTLTALALAVVCFSCSSSRPPAVDVATAWRTLGKAAEVPSPSTCRRGC